MASSFYVSTGQKFVYILPGSGSAEMKMRTLIIMTVMATNNVVTVLSVATTFTVICTLSH